MRKKASEGVSESHVLAAAFESSRRRRYFDCERAKYLAKYLHDKYVCPVTEILLSELMEAGAKRSVLHLAFPPVLSIPLLPPPPPPHALIRLPLSAAAVIANTAGKVSDVNKLLFLAAGELRRIVYLCEVSAKYAGVHPFVPPLPLCRESAYIDRFNLSKVVPAELRSPSLSLFLFLRKSDCSKSCDERGNFLVLSSEDVVICSG